jgi:hypothetical protein
MVLTATLATRLEKSPSVIRRLIPQVTQFHQYGRVYHLEGGDTMHARELLPLRSDSRDMSFVKVYYAFLIFLTYSDSYKP